MEKTWKPTVAGILEIVSGAVGIITVFGMGVSASRSDLVYIRFNPIIRRATCWNNSNGTCFTIQE